MTKLTPAQLLVVRQLAKELAAILANHQPQAVGQAQSFTRSM